ncbi:hypothetical protein [Methanosarcina sp. 2.H.A.1B.4]|uniref:hypothetical protein n=1 Tax=Methanosarcina sp. 2.H.A.1B.4 TaxID=1483600 RepID=UPI0012E0A76E|nr:hypothetical protein [Methanosarcina sp. 2.H.A.1B.4]
MSRALSRRFSRNKLRAGYEIEGKHGKKSGKKGKIKIEEPASKIIQNKKIYI